MQDWEAKLEEPILNMLRAHPFLERASTAGFALYWPGTTGWVVQAVQAAPGLPYSLLAALQGGYANTPEPTSRASAAGRIIAGPLLL